MKKIMIVDDEKISLMMTDHILSSEYKTICCSSPSEALEAFGREYPDMILSDLRMPGMNGYELLETLHSRYNVTVPFMFMTADDSDDTEARGFSSGAMDFIRKPFRADVLLRRIANILKTIDRIEGLKKAAETDPMTGLFNKASSREEIGSACRQSSGILMMIDLDSFKPVNDIYGHDMGDRVLIRFAEIIKSAVRTSDIVGRMGGDEFIAFCQNITDESVIADKCNYINEQVLSSARDLMGDDMSIPLGASIGCVICPDEGRDFDELYKKADKALYQVKQNGKHGFAFFHETASASDTESGASSDIAKICRIMSERSPSKGAFFVSSQQFKLLYQFLARMSKNYNKEVFMLLFSITEDGTTDIPSDQATEKFQEVLVSSLRQSDVVSQSSANQFTVLLLETAKVNIDVVTDRIDSNWTRTPGSNGYRITHELAIIE